MLCIDRTALTWQTKSAFRCATVIPPSLGKVESQDSVILCFFSTTTVSSSTEVFHLYGMKTSRGGKVCIESFVDLLLNQFT